MLQRNLNNISNAVSNTETIPAQGWEVGRREGGRHRAGSVPLALYAHRPPAQHLAGLLHGLLSILQWHSTELHAFGQQVFKLPFWTETRVSEVVCACLHTFSLGSKCPC